MRNVTLYDGQRDTVQSQSSNEMVAYGTPYMNGDTQRRIPIPKEVDLLIKRNTGKGPLVGCNSPLTYKRKEVFDNISVI